MGLRLLTAAEHSWAHRCGSGDSSSCSKLPSGRPPPRPHLLQEVFLDWFEEHCSSVSLLHTYPDVDITQMPPCSFLCKSLWNIPFLASQQGTP